MSFTWMMVSPAFERSWAARDEATSGVVAVERKF